MALQMLVFDIKGTALPFILISLKSAPVVWESFKPDPQATEANYDVSVSLNRPEIAP